MLKFDKIQYVVLNEEREEVKFISEISYIKTVTERDSDGRTTTKTYSVSGDMLITNYNLDGDLIWLTHIDKYYIISSSPSSFVSNLMLLGYSTTTYKENEGNIYLMFNDQKKKEEYKEAGIGKGVYYSVDVSKINPQGEEDRFVITHTNKNYKRARFDGCSSGISDNGYLILNFLKGRKYNWATAKVW